MKKNLFIFTIVIIVATAMTLYAKNVTVKKTGSKKSAVTFNHDAHKTHATKSGKNCKSCHHVGQLNQSCAAPGCHVDAVKDANGKRLHKTCLNMCHRANKAKAPTLCNDKRCHK